MLFKVLSKIGNEFNKAGVNWAVGASVLLNRYKLVESPNDIDLFIDENDAEKVDNILTTIGTKNPSPYLSTYGTKFFCTYIVDGVDIDIMGGFIVNHEKGQYEYILDEQAISFTEEIDGIAVPFTSLEDWFVLYQVMPNREPKVKMIEDYLYENGLKKPYLIERALQHPLPEDIKLRTEKLYSTLI